MTEHQKNEVELDLVLSTLREMFGDLSPASATPVNLTSQPQTGEPVTLTPLVDPPGVGPQQHHGGDPSSGVHAEPCYGSVSSRLTLDQPHAGVLVEPVHGCVPVHPVYSFPTPPQAYVWSVLHDGVYVYNQNNYMPIADVQNDAIVNTSYIVAPSYSGATVSPQVKSRQQQSGQQKSGPYIRRPPNAFMIFMRENRAKITASLKPKHSVEANSILGKMWKSMTTAEQEKYYQLAAGERRLHAEQHPEWSSKDNYGKKMKRFRGKAARLE